MFLLMLDVGERNPRAPRTLSTSSLTCLWIDGARIEVIEGNGYAAEDSPAFRLLSTVSSPQHTVLQWERIPTGTCKCWGSRL